MTHRARIASATTESATNPTTPAPTFIHLRRIRASAPPSCARRRLVTSKDVDSVDGRSEFELDACEALGEKSAPVGAVTPITRTDRHPDGVARELDLAAGIEGAGFAFERHVGHDLDRPDAFDVDLDVDSLRVK